jgi:hypothetical protein
MQMCLRLRIRYGKVCIALQVWLYSRISFLLAPNSLPARPKLPISLKLQLPKEWHGVC